jgi:hypothetical protein
MPLSAMRELVIVALAAFLIGIMVATLIVQLMICSSEKTARVSSVLQNWNDFQAAREAARRHRGTRLSSAPPSPRSGKWAC